jgi:glutamyl-tRNA synthetase
LHIRALSTAELAKRVKPYLEKAGYTVDDEKLLKISPIIQERLGGLEEAPAMAGFFFRDTVTPEMEDLTPKGMSAAESAQVARKMYGIIYTAADMQPVSLEPPMRELVEQLGLKPGQVFGLLRVAVTGQKVSPPIFESMEIIGKEQVLARLENAIAALNEIAKLEEV